METTEGPSSGRTGQCVGSYRLGRLLGRGATSEVYEATHLWVGSRAIAKVLRSELASRREEVERFLAEAYALAAVDHPCIVRLFDVARLPSGEPVLVLERVEGRTVAELVQLGPGLPVDRAMRILLQLCSALASVHARGVVHGDVKAENVIVFDAGPRMRDCVKLVDFGLSRRTGQPRLLPAGQAAGTPLYMAPELIGGGEPTPYGDVYAAGVLAFRLLAGRYPFEGLRVEDVLKQQLHTPPPHLTGTLSGFEQVMQRALSKDPTRRFPDATALFDALAGARQAPATQPAAPAAPSDAPPFTAELKGRDIILSVRSDADYDRHVAAALKEGRLFVPGLRRPLTSRVTLAAEVNGARRTERSAVVDPTHDGGDGVLLLFTAQAQARDDLVTRYFSRFDGDHYGFLSVARFAGADALVRAIDTADREVRSRLAQAESTRKRQLETILRRIEQARRTLLDPEQRARYDAALGNYRGVSRAVADGLPPRVHARLEDEFARRYPERVAQAQTWVASARALAGSAQSEARAVAALERALAFHPLSRTLHAQYAALKARAEPARAAVPSTLH